MDAFSLKSALKSGFIYFQDNHVVMQFIPILMVLFYGFYPALFLSLSNSILGKLFAIIIILFYGKINKWYGALACVLIIAFYQYNNKDIDAFAEMIDEKMLAGSNVADEWRKQNCINGILKNKGVNVKSDMAQHVFPELEFVGGSTCNPCDKACDIKIVESKLETEKHLKTPKNSRDFMSIIDDLFADKSKGENFVPIEAAHVA